MTDRERLKNRVAMMNDAEVTEVLEYITIMESLRDQAVRPDLLADVFAELVIERPERIAAAGGRTHQRRTLLT